MGEEDTGTDLIPANTSALTQRSAIYGEMAETFTTKANEQEALPDQAAQMHAAIEASRQQIAQSLRAFKNELDHLPEDIKEEAVERGQALADDLSEKAKTFFDEKVKQGSINWIKANPLKAVGISFAIGFYIAMD